MTPFYEGTTEAEHLIRGSPELVEPWLKKARQDRNRVAVRLFQSKKKEFLDGFIRALETHLVQRNQGTAAESEAVVTEATAAGTEASDEREVTPTQAAEEPLEVGPMGGTAAEPADFDGEPAKAEVSPIMAGAQPEPAEVKPSSELAEVEMSSVEPLLANQQTDAGPGGQELDTTSELALGVMKISGWTVDIDPERSDFEPVAGIDPASSEPNAPSAQTGEPVPSASWSQVFEQARGVGMVDLSAYDFIDGLGELRDLIDHWHDLQQDSSSGEGA